MKEEWLKDLMEGNVEYWNSPDRKFDLPPANNFVVFGQDNPMYGLRGTYHPASKWHKEERGIEWTENVRRGVLGSWKGNDKRRKEFSKKMSSTWENNYEYMAEQSRKNGNHGLTGKDIHNTIEIEYKGETYWGWKSLLESTGVSKRLYKGYYLNGIDPVGRIGKDGPPPKDYNIMNKLNKTSGQSLEKTSGQSLEMEGQV